MSRPRYAPTISELRELLDYDPETGLLTWRSDRSPRVRAGDEAGCLTPDGVRVTIKRHPISAPKICASFLYGRWIGNDYTVRTIGDPSDLRAANLTAEPRGYSSDTVEEAHERELNRKRLAAYRARKKEAKLAAMRERGDLRSAVPGVTYNESTGLWVCAVTPPEGVQRRAARHQSYSVVIGDRYKTRRAAEDAALGVYAGRRHVLATPIPSPTTREDIDAFQSRVTPSADTYAELHRVLCYDPGNGAIYWREGVRQGVRADVPYGNGRPGRVVVYHSHYYPAHRLAWALTTGEWPSKNLRHKDGDTSNNRLSNLYLKEEGVLK